MLLKVGGVTVVGLLIIVAVVFALGSRSVEIPVDSVPPGAEVFVDGERVGVTPVSYAVSRRRGQIKLELSAMDRESFSKTIALPMFGEIEPWVVAMPFQRTSLEIRSRPDGAKVTIDGREVGTTPFEIDSLSTDESHLVELNREGCVPARLTIELEEAEKLVKEVELRSLGAGAIAAIHILSEDHLIWLDGEDVTTATRKSALLVYSGSHTLKTSHRGETEEKILDLKPATLQRVDLRVPPHFPPKPEMEKPQKKKRRRNRRPPAKPTGVLASYDNLIDYGIYILSTDDTQAAEEYCSRALMMANDPTRARRCLIITAAARDQPEPLKKQLRSFIGASGRPSERIVARTIVDAIGKKDSCR